MPNFSLLFAGSLQDAEDSALADWRWEIFDHLHFEFRRPDSGERVRFVQDRRDTLDNLRWNTRIYLGRNWKRRQDAMIVENLVLERFFVLGDPTLPPPRKRRTDRLEVLKTELRGFLGGMK
jgi:hypothetical protein